jgi:tRNA pseudouridine13 synthase
LPRWTPGPGAGGSWKQQPEDFVVEEVPLAPPTGSGEHAWLRVEKVGLTTLDVVERLARQTGAPAEAIGYAGLKDRQARTVQEFTVPCSEAVGAAIPELLGPDVRVLARGRTAKRLRVGQLAGNVFTIRVAGGDANVAEARLERLRGTGMPNYYGVQRVGGDAPLQGRATLLGRGPRLGHAALKFALSAYQSELFNRVLARRGARALDGDLLEDGVPTGPMYGAQMRWPTGAAEALELEVLEAEGIPVSAWQRFGNLTQGTRRKLWVPVDATLTREPGGFLLRFRLPAGSYATELLEELL